MAPITKGPPPTGRSSLDQVSLNPAHYRSGRWVLLAEAVVVGGLGCAGLISFVRNPAAAQGWGAPVLCFTVTPVHSAALLGFGVLAGLATVTRRTTIAATVIGVVGFVLLFTIGANVASGGVPRVWGLDARDAVLHAVLMLVNLVLLVWLFPDGLQDPAWIPRRRSPGSRA